MFAKALKGQDIEALLSNIGSAAAAPAGAAPVQAAAPVKEVKEESTFFAIIVHVISFRKRKGARG